MRRYTRSGGGGTAHAHRAAGPPVPDSLSLIRSFDSETISTRPLRPSPLSTSTFYGLPLDLVDRLRSFPLFQSAPDSFLAAIGTYLRPQLHQPHDYILTEGDDAKAMFWLVRGAVRVTSRDGESTYAELKPGAFFGEIGILMDIPRTATIVAKLKSMVVRLNKEDLQKVLPDFPEVERVIREEAKERLTILERKKKEMRQSSLQEVSKGLPRKGKRSRDRMDGDVEMGDAGALRSGQVVSSSRKRKSPSPGLAEAAASSAFGSGSMNVRQLLKELPLFASLPPEILHFLGLNAQPRTYPPFTDIIQQGSQGRDIFFIVRGEVEVVTDKTLDRNGKSTKDAMDGRKLDAQQRIKARLKPGQYFGEVTSLLLAPSRTATVRSIGTVECLMISRDVLNELWRRCSPDLRRQVEDTAKQRLKAAVSEDIVMTDTSDGTPAISELAIADQGPKTPSKPTLPKLTLTGSAAEPSLSPGREDKSNMEPYDPDPFLSVDLENVRSRSRRGSLAPPLSSSHDSSQHSVNETHKAFHTNGQAATILSSSYLQKPTPAQPQTSNKRPKILRYPSHFGKGTLPDNVLVQIFQYLDILELMRFRLVSIHWMKMLSTSPDLLHGLDLSTHNRYVTDYTLINIICPFVGPRPRTVDISNCFHVTDEGFTALANTCGASVKTWKMKSVWDVTGQAVLEMVNKAKGLEEIDLSNCRKVGDNLLARVVGWVIPDIPPALMQPQQQVAQQINGQSRHNQKQHVQSQQQPQQPLCPGTVVGCPRLKRLTLSYCKHITDRSMAHISVHASNRLEAIDLTRCTTITDQGFQHWSVYPFPRLRKLCLADCTYLTDNAIVYLANAAKGLRELDLSFCCALSDTATEVLSLGLPQLAVLNLAFCGSAVSDTSLRSIGLHLLELRELSVRGCVRVTGTGVEAVVDGCHGLRVFDVSQCKNLARWIEGGGIEGVQSRGRRIEFQTVADGRWRCSS